MEKRPHILVVDDEAVVRASFDRALSEQGYAVETAGSGIQALDMVSSGDYDVAFVDLKMPGMDGMEVVRNIRRSHPMMEVVIVTGYGTAERAKEAVDLGVADVVAKPVTPDDLGALAEKVIHRRRETPRVIPPAPAVAPAATPVETPSIAKRLAILVAGPIAGLTYVIFLPLIGFAMLFWLAGKWIIGKSLSRE